MIKKFTKIKNIRYFYFNFKIYRLIFCNCLNKWIKANSKNLLDLHKTQEIKDCKI